MASVVCRQLSGKSPSIVSSPSNSASAPSSTMLAMSVASARVGLGAEIIESISRVTTHGFPIFSHMRSTCFCTANIFSGATAVPSSPRESNTTSASFIVAREVPKRAPFDLRDDPHVRQTRLAQFLAQPTQRPRVGHLPEGDEIHPGGRRELLDDESSPAFTANRPGLAKLTANCLTVSCISTDFAHRQTTSRGFTDTTSKSAGVSPRDGRMDADRVSLGVGGEKLERSVVGAEGEDVRGFEDGFAVHESHGLSPLRKRRGRCRRGARRRRRRRRGRRHRAQTLGALLRHA